VNAVHRAEGAISPSVVPISLEVASSPNPWGAPGPPDGLNEPDYPEWLSPLAYRQILVGKQWIQSWIRDELWEPGAKWQDVVTMEDFRE
jgi:hypothetical protein